MSFSSSSNQQHRPRPLLVKRLQNQLPRLNLVSVIFRVAQFVVLFGLTVAYATSEPQVYLDIFVWQKDANPPYEITVYRKFAPWWQISENKTLSPLDSRDTLPHYTFQWNDTRRIPGVTEPYVCLNDRRFRCNGTQWVSSRLGWLDSWPTLTPQIPPWIMDSTYIDRYIFWLIMAGSFLSMGHNVIVLTHAIEPSGFGFYKYVTAMDFIISSFFLLIGIFPMAIDDHLKEFNKSDSLDIYYIRLPKSWFMDGLQEHQKWAFAMGWVMWGLYITTFILNAVLLAGLIKYRSLPEIYEMHRPDRSELSMLQTDGPADVGTSSSVQPKNLQNSRGSTYSRASGRDIIRLIDVI